MALVQLLFSTATSSCRSIMNRTLHNFSGTCLLGSPFKDADQFAQLPRKLRVCSAFTRSQPKVLRIKSERKSCALKSHSYGLWPFSASIQQPNMRVASLSGAIQMNVISYRSIVGFESQCYAFVTGKRSFSKVSGALTHKNDAVGIRGGGSDSNSTLKVYNKYWKRKKAFSAHRRNAISNIGPGRGNSSYKASDTKAPGTVSSKDGIPMDKMKDVELDTSHSSDTSGSRNSNGVSKVKQARSKKSKNHGSDNTAACDEANHLKDPEKVSQAKKPKPKKKNQSPVASQINTTQSTSTEILENDVLTKDSKPKPIKSSRKKKTDKGVAALSKSDESPADSSSSEVSQSHKSQMSGKSSLQGKFPQLYPPVAKSVVVVESVTKAKVIQGYLGDMFEVLPSYGHVRDLAARSGSVRPDDNFSMVWEVPSRAWTHLKSIKVALSGAKNLILASDPDREGEAIAWHIIEMLQQQDTLRNDITVARVVFNEITESSIKNALQAPREIDVSLVHAYLARRALDYLIGFNISPLLWRKLPSCQSAGRVQSAALSLICDRETEIDKFKPQEYWTIEVEFNKKDTSSTDTLSFSSNLTHFSGKKLSKVSIGSYTEARDIEQKINSSKFEVIASKESKSQRNAPSPYITSTLQQEAANKLNFSASYTMKLAQKLYEGVQLADGEAVGLITYMRTDGSHISDDAVKDLQSFVTERYGQNFASKSARKYFKKVKNAQEAHEAIRPTNIRRLPSVLAGVLDDDSVKLYKLIWSRTIASQMEPAIIDQVQLDIANTDRSIMLRSSCSRVEFLGYQTVFEDVESKTVSLNENEVNNRGELFKVLSTLKSGDSLNLGKVELEQHYTQPPPRYSEGALIKKMEELGIGRPSTYAITIKVLKDRNYVTINSRVMHPEFRGRMVSAFLSHYFSEVTDYSFTADMETELDNVSAGLTEWKGLLKDYWTRFSKYCTHAINVHIHQVEKMLEKEFSDFLFASLPDGSRRCPSCLEGNLIFKVSRFGAGYFIGCDQHPRCKYIAKTLCREGDEEIPSDNNNNKNMEEPKLLGLNPGTNEKVLLKSGPYGNYVQLGEDREGFLPKRASLNNVKDLDCVTLEVALELLRYPVTLGKHPDDGRPVTLFPGKKKSFVIRHGRTFAPVPKNIKSEDVTLEQAMEFLKGPNTTRVGRPVVKKKLEESIEAIY
ncbi:uncharacterized protein LOC113783689 isoform X2 [Coffea eugenioides]|uniref:uncharacterized protein LOC113783689 isoform X2 n=1 Tax=Coffea eugenioides TaxID=49369 RepID=UPI000F612FF0|nr:uncharacterized protein LOC113783689 isoform X2 [Coffea eugenioides]